jgi:hypothetical protein
MKTPQILFGLFIGILILYLLFSSPTETTIPTPTETTPTETTQIETTKATETTPAQTTPTETTPATKATETTQVKTIDSTPAVIIPKYDKFSYIGCYKDDTNRILANYLGDYDSLDKCYNAAYPKGYKYIGMQYNAQCFADNNDNYDKYGKLSDTECSYKITGISGNGDKTTNIGSGGSWTDAIYKVNNPKQFVYNIEIPRISNKLFGLDMNGLNLNSYSNFLITFWNSIDFGLGNDIAPSGAAIVFFTKWSGTESKVRIHKFSLSGCDINANNTRSLVINTTNDHNKLFGSIIYLNSIPVEIPKISDKIFGINMGNYNINNFIFTYWCCGNDPDFGLGINEQPNGSAIVYYTPWGGSDSKMRFLKFNQNGCDIYYDWGTNVVKISTINSFNKLYGNIFNLNSVQLTVPKIRDKVFSINMNSNLFKEFNCFIISYIANGDYGLPNDQSPSGGAVVLFTRWSGAESKYRIFKFPQVSCDIYCNNDRNIYISTINSFNELYANIILLN